MIVQKREKKEEKDLHKFVDSKYELSPEMTQLYLH